MRTMIHINKKSLSLLMVGVSLLQFGNPAVAGPLPPAGGGLTVAMQVEVSRGGVPMSGLSFEDFVVRDKGKELSVVDVLEVISDGGGIELPEEAYRQLLLLFDLEFPDPRFVVRATDFAKELLSPNRFATTRVLIAAHEPSSGLRIEVELTDDRDRLLEMLGILHDEHERRIASSVATSGPVVTGDDLITSRARNNESDKGIVQREQGRILGLVQSLSRLEVLTRSVPGSTQVVLFSPGFDSSVILGNQATQQLDSQGSVEQAEASARGDFSAVNSASRYGGGLVETALFETLSDYARMGVPIHSVDIQQNGESRPVRMGAQGPNGLTIMAGRTGGQVFRGSGDLREEVSLALQPAGSIYLLTFQSRAIKSRGRYRRVDVRLKERTKDLKVTAPRGYFVP